MPGLKGVKKRVRGFYDKTKTKVTNTRNTYQRIYNSAYKRGWYDCRNGNEPMFSSIVASVGYGNGYHERRKYYKVLTRYASKN